MASIKVQAMLDLRRIMATHNQRLVIQNVLQRIHHLVVGKTNLDLSVSLSAPLRWIWTGTTRMQDMAKEDQEGVKKTLQIGVT